MKRHVFTAFLWASAAAVWISMGHELLGSPDLASVGALVVFSVTLLVRLARQFGSSPVISRRAGRPASAR